VRSGLGIFVTPIGGSFAGDDDLAADPFDARPATGFPFLIEPASTDAVCGTKFRDREGECETGRPNLRSIVTGAGGYLSLGRMF
jgi:hypothetical protein